MTTGVSNPVLPYYLGSLLIRSTSGTVNSLGYYSREIVIPNVTSVSALTLGSTTAGNIPTLCANTPIYVPDALVSGFQAASGWSSAADNFRPLSDYPDY